MKWGNEIVVVYLLQGRQRGVRPARPVRPRSYLDFGKYNAAAAVAASYGDLSLPRRAIAPLHICTINYENNI